MGNNHSTSQCFWLRFICCTKSVKIRIWSFHNKCLKSSFNPSCKSAKEEHLKIRVQEIRRRFSNQIRQINLIQIQPVCYNLKLIKLRHAIARQCKALHHIYLQEMRLLLDFLHVFHQDVPRVANLKTCSETNSGILRAVFQTLAHQIATTTLLVLASQ